MDGRSHAREAIHIGMPLEESKLHGISTRGGDISNEVRCNGGVELPFAEDRCGRGLEQQG